ncbi:MAG: glycosyltransferase family 2 protein [Jaaginema sp. PMC 1079.18]|nr:glycosyltransferase family 2 protein [Jaaginema sp. PMC 1080.18]MEC4853517.1 glycosyltransferase family 2 protein [Jaaginema sp. PMC 1079.18]
MFVAIFPSETLVSTVSLWVLVFTVPAIAIFLSRLSKGPQRRPPVAPQRTTLNQLGKVSVVVPTLNEVERVAPCLAGLSAQSYEVREILIVDSNSTDGTRELVKNAANQDPRLRLLTDDPLPQDWVGRPWALHNGFLSSSRESEWILGVDADTQPQPGLVAGLLATAQAEDYDLVSCSPQFILQYPGEWWLQPALLMTLLYRFDPAGTANPQSDRVMANGQCFFYKRSVLAALGGYESAKRSFCDDVTLARYVASQGYRVGFLDGKKIIKVRMYEGWRETWQEWGRSLDLKDACSPAQLNNDLWVLLSAQALPLPLTLLGLGLMTLGYSSLPLLLLTSINGVLIAIRWALLFAIAPSYDWSQASPAAWLFWLSPLADPLAVYRIFLSAQTQPQSWRGRDYGTVGSGS